MRHFHLAATVAFSMALGCAQDTPPNASAKESWLPYPIGATVADKTIEQWAMDWNRWSYAQTSCDSPITDVDGSQCALYQDEASPVFFLTFAPSKAVRRGCRVPRGKALFVPIAAFAVDNVDEEPPLSGSDMEEIARDVLTAMGDMKLTVDGSDVSVEDARAVQPQRHTVALPSTPNFYSCRGIDGYENTVLDPVYVTGYFAMLPPPAPGTHTLSYVSVIQDSGISARCLANMELHVGVDP